MLGRLLRLFIILPALVAITAFCNTAGITAEVSRVTGYDIPDAMTIPGLAQVLDAREKVGNVEGKAKAKARRMAVAALKKEVSRRYGPEAAALIPNDLTLREAKNFDFKAFENTVREKLPDVSIPTVKPPTLPVPIPGTGGGKKYAQAAKTLDTLAVKGRAPMTGYDRDEFGTEWSDRYGNWKGWSNNGCDSRNDALARELGSKAVIASDCSVKSGTFTEPYSQKTFEFIAGDRSMDHSLDIDHVVALGNTWVSGSWKWSEDKRALIANDPLNLLAVSASLNRQKSDADAATWLPPAKSYRCEYVSRQIQVKAKYALSVTSAEKAAMKSVLAKCA